MFFVKGCTGLLKEFRIPDMLCSVVNRIVDIQLDPANASRRSYISGEQRA
jgi:hypothetical protein